MHAGAGTFFDQAAGPFTYNWAAQGLNFGGDFLDDDLNGSALAVTWNTANMTANGSLGALLLHHQNASGQRAEVVLLQGSSSADLAITQSVNNANPAAGGTVIFTLRVTNNGPNNATGVAVNDFLPDGVNWVSDDGGGAYNANTGLWTVGALANAASATLHITATVDTTEPLSNVSSLAGSTPLDPNPANDQATVNLMAPRTADLGLTFNAAPASVNPGSTITYTLTVKNISGDPAYSVNVHDAFPLFPALTAASSNASQGVYNAATGVWNLASLPVGDTATLTFTGHGAELRRQPGEQRHHRRPQVVAARQDGRSVAGQQLGERHGAGALARHGHRHQDGRRQLRRGGQHHRYTIVLSNNSGNFDQQDNPGQRAE